MYRQYYWCSFTVPIRAQIHVQYSLSSSLCGIDNTFWLLEKAEWWPGTTSPSSRILAPVGENYGIYECFSVFELFVNNQEESEY